MSGIGKNPYIYRSESYFQYPIPGFQNPGVGSCLPLPPCGSATASPTPLQSHFLQTNKKMSTLQCFFFLPHKMRKKVLLASPFIY